MSVSAIIVTRGDVDLEQVRSSIPQGWETLVWDNGAGHVMIYNNGSSLQRWHGKKRPGNDVSVFGRYAAIQHATGDLIYVQDDDCIVSDPAKLVAAWEDSRAKCSEEQFDPRFLWHASSEEIHAIGKGEHVVCNMPQEFRHDFYTDHALVGFGAVFHRDAPERAFNRFFGEDTWPELRYGGFVAVSGPGDGILGEHFRRTCDIVLTALTPRVLVDVPKENLPWAEGEERMYRQPEHVGERKRMLDTVMAIR